MMLAFALCVHSATAAGTNTCPTKKELADACILTTSTTCEQSCKDVLSNLPSGPDCLSDLLVKARAYGITDEFICNWRAPCEVDKIPGITCGHLAPPKEDKKFKTELVMAIPDVADVDAFFGNTAELNKWKDALSISLVGDDSIARLITISYHSSGGSSPVDARRLASMELQVVIFSPDEAGTADYQTALEEPTFTASLTSALTAKGATTSPPLEIDTSTISSKPGVETYVLPEYKASGDVETIRGYSPSGEDEDWDSWDTDYQKGLGGVFALAMVFGFLMIVSYWFFMCCHNVHWLCGKGMLGCIFRKCNCCSNKKSFGTRTQSKIALCIMYSIVFIAAMSSWYGRNHFQDGVAKMGESLGDVATIFEDITDAGNEFVAEANAFSTLTNIGAVCYDNDESKDILVTMSDAFSEAANAVGGKLDGLSDSVREMQNTMTDSGSTLVDAAVAAITALFVLVAFLGILGTVTGSRTILGFANFLGVIILIVMTILIAVELTLSVVLADFCGMGTGPNHNMIALANETMGGEGQTDNLEIFTYYVTCEGTNPLGQPLSDMKDFADIISMQTRGLGTVYLPNPIARCNNDHMIKFYSPTDGINKDIQATLMKIETSVGCSAITPILVKVTHDAICDSLVSGLYSLWMAQAVASFFLLISLVYAAFVREHFKMSICPILCGGSKGDGKNPEMEKSATGGVGAVVPVDGSGVVVNADAALPVALGTGDGVAQEGEPAAEAASDVVAIESGEAAAEAVAEPAAEAAAEPAAEAAPAVGEAN
jgi:hypothetical protein